MFMPSMLMWNTISMPNFLFFYRNLIYQLILLLQEIIKLSYG